MAKPTPKKLKIDQLPHVIDLLVNQNPTMPNVITMTTSKNGTGYNVVFNFRGEIRRHHLDPADLENGQGINTTWGRVTFVYLEENKWQVIINKCLDNTPHYLLYAPFTPLPPESSVV